MSEAKKHEEYVRSRWGLVHRCDGSYRHYERSTVLLQDTHGHWLDFSDWSAAYAFTKEREEQIRQIEEEIAEIDFVPLHDAVWKRILAREQAALAELKRGMK